MMISSMMVHQKYPVPVSATKIKAIKPLNGWSQPHTRHCLCVAFVFVANKICYLMNCQLCMALQIIIY